MELPKLFESFDRFNGRIYPQEFFEKAILDLEKRTRKESRKKKILNLFT